VKAKQINAQNSARAERSSEKRDAEELMEKLPNSMQRSLSLAAEKRSLILAVNPSHRRTWFRTPQKCIQRCPLLALWVAASTPSITVSLRQEAQHQPCLQLYTWRLPLSETQQNQGHHSRLTEAKPLCKWSP